MNLKNFLRTIKWNIQGNIDAMKYAKKPLKNTVLVMNFVGKGYGDSGKYIVEYVKKNNINLDIVWVLNSDIYDTAILPEGVRKVKYKSLEFYEELYNAKVHIDNCRKAYIWKKRKGQLYIATTHSMLALKKVEADVEEKLTWFYIHMAKKDSKDADYMVSASEFKSKCMQTSYWYNGKILKTGLPRTDILINFDENIKDKVYNYFKIPKDKKMLIYAPTYRHDGNLDCYKLEFDNILQSLSQKFDGEWVILVRLHSNISGKSDFIKYNESILNATHYEDLQEIMMASEIMITDYSSCMFEFSLMKKPVFLFATDVEDYKKDRDFYIKLEELPYKISENNLQLINNIKDYESKEYLEKLENFENKIGLYPLGNSSKTIVDIIEKFMQ